MTDRPRYGFDESMGLVFDGTKAMRMAGVASLLNTANEIYSEQSRWKRSEFTSIWVGPDIELIVVQNGGGSESWQWTARGWREPDDCDGADKWRWVETSSRDAAEKAALMFYLEKDE